jgi:hypothetical protein
VLEHLATLEPGWGSVAGVPLTAARSGFDSRPVH